MRKLRLLATNVTNNTNEEFCDIRGRIHDFTGKSYY